MVGHSVDVDGELVWERDAGAGIPFIALRKLARALAAHGSKADGPLLTKPKSSRLSEVTGFACGVAKRSARFAFLEEFDRHWKFLRSLSFCMVISDG